MSRIALQTLRVLLVVVLMAAGFAGLFLFATQGFHAMAVAALGVAIAALVSIHLCEKAIERLLSTEAKEEGQWSGAELIVSLRWGRPIFLASICGALAAAALMFAMNGERNSAPVLVSGALALLLAWMTLIFVSAMARALASGYALRADASGIYAPGRTQIPWNRIHGAAVVSYELKGQRQATLQLLVSGIEEYVGFSMGRLLLGPLEAMWGSRYLRINCTMLAVHEERLKAAIQALAKRHAPRFDSGWYAEKSLADALRSADMQKSEQSDKLEFEAANAAMLAVASRVKDVKDPEFTRARRRLEDAMAREAIRRDAIIQEIGAATQYLNRSAKKAKWFAIGAVLLVVLVVASKIYLRGHDA